MIVDVERRCIEFKTMAALSERNLRSQPNPIHQTGSTRGLDVCHDNRGSKILVRGIEALGQFFPLGHQGFEIAAVRLQ